MKKIATIFMVLIIATFGCITSAQQIKRDGFSDVPKGDKYEEYIYKLKELNITNGKGDGTFGYNQKMTRVEFLSFLTKLMHLEEISQKKTGLFKDIKSTDWHYTAVYNSIKNGIIVQKEYADGMFEPKKAITREEIAVMLVRALQYDRLAQSIEGQAVQFSDLTTHKGYIEIVKSLGVMNGRSETAFEPKVGVLKQEAAEVLVKLYNSINNKADLLNGFYAIKSNNQLGRTAVFNSISYGWSRLDYNKDTGKVELTTKLSSGGHPFYVPGEYQVATAEADKYANKKYIMVFASNEDKVNINGQEIRLVSQLLSDEAAVQKLITDIANMSNGFEGDTSYSRFDGVVIDFEALRDTGNDKANFVKFLTALKQQLNVNQKQLLVCINPKREAGQQFYNGYDFANIGQTADYVILMAHDYEPKSLSAQEMLSFKGETPIAPIKDIYLALKYATDPKNGIPKEKLLLQLNFGAAQWQFKDGKVVNNRPYVPDYAKIAKRISDTAALNKKLTYSDVYQSPYLSYESEGIKNIVWYEDARSISAKIRLAQRFGIKGISVWRLGQVPDFEQAQTNVQYLNLWPVLENLRK